MSKFCTKCGTEFPDDTVFCTNCGTKLEEAPAAESTASQPVNSSFEEPAQPVNPEPVPVIQPEPDSRPAPAPIFNPAPSPAPRTDTEAAFGVAPEAPGAEYHRPEPAYIPPQEPVYNQPIPQEQFYDPSECKVVSTGAYFWLDFLYFIPVIGFIACIIIAAASKNLNIKHHACAKLIEVLVALVVLIILSILTVIAIYQLNIDYNEIFNKIKDLFYY